jgi:hypothetical protein
VLHRVPFAAGMGMCTTGLKSKRPGDRKGEGGIEGIDHDVTSFHACFSLYTLTGTFHLF